MDMYQKIKKRQEKKNNNESNKNSINWLITIYLNSLANSYK